MTDDCKKKARDLAERLEQKRKSDIEKLTDQMKKNQEIEIKKITTSFELNLKTQIEGQKIQLNTDCKNKLNKLNQSLTK